MNLDTQKLLPLRWTPHHPLPQTAVARCKKAVNLLRWAHQLERDHHSGERLILDTAAWSELFAGPAGADALVRFRKLLEVNYELRTIAGTLQLDDYLPSPAACGKAA